MPKLISKLQYRDFETGEFADACERSYEETIRLIDRFPWDMQRQKLVIGLTNPSIVIEGRDNDYLKLAVSFNQKYVLYYFDAKGDLFSKRIAGLDEAYGHIKQYFDRSRFDPGEFKKEITWFQSNLRHFQTNGFRYEVTGRRISRYLLATSGMNFVISIFLIGLLLSGKMGGMGTIGFLFFAAVIFFLGGGLHLILFSNYYNCVRDKILIISRGNDVFFFGRAGQPLEFNKKDIVRYRTVRLRGSRNPLSEFALIEIEFKDGAVLKIPNLLIGYPELENKLFQYPRIDIEGFPFVVA